MAGFRDFQTGEVLTAANVNDFLMKQSILKFADATARDTALGTAVGGSNALREGMVAYLDDTDEVLAYDGTSWSSLGLPLGTATPTDGQILAFGTATSTWNPTDGGKLVQVVTGTTIGGFSTTSTSYVDSNLSATITPTSSSSKIVVLVQVEKIQQNLNGEDTRLALFRGNVSGTFIPSGVRLSRTSASGFIEVPAALMAVDSPATTSATTYVMGIRTTDASNTATVDDRQNMILMEVAG